MREVKVIAVDHRVERRPRAGRRHAPLEATSCRRPSARARAQTCSPPPTMPLTPPARGSCPRPDPAGADGVLYGCRSRAGSTMERASSAARESAARRTSSGPVPCLAADLVELAPATRATSRSRPLAARGLAGGGRGAAPGAPPAQRWALLAATTAAASVVGGARAPRPARGPVRRPPGPPGRDFSPRPGTTPSAMTRVLDHLGPDGLYRSAFAPGIGRSGAARGTHVFPGGGLGRRRRRVDRRRAVGPASCHDDRIDVLDP